MKRLNKKYYTEVIGQRCVIHFTEKTKLRERKETKSNRIQCHVIDDTEKGRKQKDNKMEMINQKSNHIRKKLKQKVEASKIEECPRCKQRKYIDFAKGYYCENFFKINSKPNHQRDKKVLRQDKICSKRLPNANKNSRKQDF